MTPRQKIRIHLNSAKQSIARLEERLVARDAEITRLKNRIEELEERVDS